MSYRVIAVAAVTCDVCSYFANKYMKHYSPHGVEQEVEWLYSFDVHCNSFFCSFLITYVLQVMSRVFVDETAT